MDLHPVGIQQAADKVMQREPNPLYTDSTNKTRSLLRGSGNTSLHDGVWTRNLSAGGRNPSLWSLVSVTSFTADVVQSPSPFLRSVVVEADAVAACFLLFLAAAPAAVPSSCLLLGAMEVAAVIEVEVNLVVSVNGKRVQGRG